VPGSIRLYVILGLCCQLESCHDDAKAGLTRFGGGEKETVP
jgi:hypothetical protein